MLWSQVDEWRGRLKGSQRVMQKMVGKINDTSTSEGEWDTGSSAGAEAVGAISQQDGAPKPQDVKFVISAELQELALHISGQPPEVWKVPEVSLAATILIHAAQMATITTRTSVDEHGPLALEFCIAMWQCKWQRIFQVRKFQTAY